MPLGHILYAHLTDGLFPLIVSANSRHTIITTQRNPKYIRESWIRRNKDMSKLPEQLLNHQRLLELHPYVVMLGGGKDRLYPEMVK